MTRVLLAAVLLVAGGFTAVATVAVHARWWGLALSVCAVAVAVVGIPPGWFGRLPFALGFGVVVGLLTRRRSEGDYVLGAEPAGYAVLVLAVVVVAVALVTLPRPRRAPRPDDVGTDTYYGPR